MPNEFIVQIALLMVASALFAAAFIVGLRHMRRAAAEGGGGPTPVTSAEAPSMGPTARIMVLTGTCLSIALLAWRVIEVRHIALPLTNHYDAFLSLALLLTGMVLYLRWTSHLRGLAFFLFPMIALLLLIGAVLAIPQKESSDYQNVWTRLHLLSIVVGSVCFAAGCVAGMVYLLAARQLKRKGAAASARRWIGLPPLASIERANRILLFVGFPMLTIAMITGVLRVAGDPGKFHSFNLGSPKVVLAVLAWIVYALLLHVPLAPAFRGRRAALLSILGFVLFIGAYVAVMWMK